MTPPAGQREPPSRSYTVLALRVRALEHHCDRLHYVAIAALLVALLAVGVGFMALKRATRAVAASAPQSAMSVAP